MLTSSLGDWVGKLLLADVVLAITVATMAIQTAATRMLFSMARDGAMPLSGALSRVSPRTGMPAGPALVTGVGAAAILLLNFASPEAFLAIGTTCIVLLYLAYAMVTGPLLLQRLRGGWRGGAPGGFAEDGSRLFSMGRWGLPVNALAFCYGLAMMVNLAWPRTEVYAPITGHWFFQWFTLLFLAAVVALGALYRRLRRPAAGLARVAQIPVGNTGQA
ncbi:hypothetical protein GCM10027612_44120 [Microbispora bryophytorum subsp. camponoti]